MRVIRDPGFRRFRYKTIYFDCHRSRSRSALDDLHSDLSILVLESRHLGSTWSSTGAHSYSTGSNMPAPVRESPKALARDDRLLVVGYADEFGVCCSALNADPVQVGGGVGAGDGVVDFVCPVQALAGAAVGVKGRCPGTLEIRILGLPDVVGGVDWASWLGGVRAGTMSGCIEEMCGVKYDSLRSNSPK